MAVTNPQTQELVTKFDQVIRHSFSEVQKDIEYIQMTNLILMKKVLLMEKKFSNFETTEGDDLVTKDELEDALDALKLQFSMLEGRKGKFTAMKDALVSFFTEEITDYPVLDIPRPGVAHA